MRLEWSNVSWLRHEKDSYPDYLGDEMGPGLVLRPTSMSFYGLPSTGPDKGQLSHKL